MSTYNPISALVIFGILVFLAYMLFRPHKGWFWLIRKSTGSRDKIVVEDILKLMYHNENKDHLMNVSDIVRNVNNRESLVVKCIHNMVELKLIDIDGEVLKLTQLGSDYALRIVRAHRLWEKFLAEKTGFKEEEWHRLAEQKEHELTPNEADLLASRLGNPQFDPHGDPIPTNTGKIAEIDGISLSNLEEDTMGRIVHIKDKPDVIYRQILAENIHIGSIIRVVEKNESRVVFHSEGEAFILAPIIAANITVNVLAKDAVLEDQLARLSILNAGEHGEIIGISREIRGDARRRLLDLGFVKGAEVSIDLLNPLGDPTAFLIKGTSIALRKDQASKILIKKKEHGS